mmetsp:Transcript_48940/g.60157  ORF Transcript_48940/g.60157 Transcript_48940/m.60157 type:complete len:123 (+) Transcript_48940:1664-2032(+)
MFRPISKILPIAQKSLMNTSKQLNYNSMRYASLLLELRSGRLGKIEVETTKDLIKIFERTGAIGIIPEDIPDDVEEIPVVTEVDKIQKGVVYQMCYASDEADAYDEAMDEDVDESEYQAQPK